MTPTFAETPAPAALRRALDAKGYTSPTPVQAAVLDPGLAGKDLLVSSQTGSGKTVAFGLLVGEALLAGADALPRSGRPGALVVAPTRELALQVARELGWLLAEAGGRVATCVGGMDPRREARALEAGAHVAVGTPGRLLDHHRRRALDLSAVAVLVLDEADEMLDLGFREELEALLAAAPPARRTILFSATLPAPVVDLARRYTRDATRVAASPVAVGHADIAFVGHLVAPGEREHAVVNVLRAADPPAALVFRATREAVQHTSASLAERGFACVAISGELTQPERTRALHALRDGRARVLVATDVAARGLDLPGLDLVVHADLPRDPEALQHRSGRTGRAGRKGTAVLLASPAERLKLERMLRAAGIRAAWRPVPAADEIRAADEARLGAALEALAGPAAEVSEEERATAARLLDGRDPIAVAVALVRRERERLPAPEELPETAAAAREAPRRAEARGPRAEAPKETVWFRVSLGRAKKADPKWILPLVCRRGGVTRDAIGKIVVLEDETRFEIAREQAEQFARSARKPDPRAAGVVFAISTAPSGAAFGPRRGAAPASARSAPASAGAGHPRRDARSPRPGAWKPRPRRERS